MGEGHFSIENELEADCGAGLYFAYAGRLGMLDNNDLRNAAKGFFEAGSSSDSPWFEPDFHGTSQQRVTSFLTGYYGTINDCYHIVAKPPAGDVALPAGPFQVPLLGGAKAHGLSGGYISHGYKVTFPGTKAYALVVSEPSGNLAHVLKKDLVTTHIDNPLLRQLVLAAPDGIRVADIQKLLPTQATGFAAVTYHFHNGGRWDGIGVAANTDQGAMAIYSEGPDNGHGTNDDVAYEVLTLLAGAQ